MFVKISGETHCFWRAVDQDDEVLGSFVTRASDEQAALRSTKNPLKRHGSLAVITTDGLGSRDGPPRH